MTDLAGLVRRTVECPVGVNVLRNDAETAVAVAAAAGADFVRVNVHTGARVTDQGVIEGRAHDTLRLRDRLDAEVSILADTGVKHSTPLGGAAGTGDDVDDLIDRGLADGVIVSGPRTGEAVDTGRLDAVAERCADRDTPLYVGSGVTADTVDDLLSAADGVIVGTALKRGGETTAPVEEARVRALVDGADA